MKALAAVVREAKGDFLIEERLLLAAALPRGEMAGSVGMVPSSAFCCTVSVLLS